jgi:hypothetical protein
MRVDRGAMGETVKEARISLMSRRDLLEGT